VGDTDFYLLNYSLKLDDFLFSNSFGSTALGGALLLLILDDDFPEAAIGF